MRYYEDVTSGETSEHGTRTVDRDEIVAFAEQYDPQPFHVDERHAEQTMFGGLIASGLHTLSVCNGLATDGVFEDLAIVGGRGIDHLRFHDPVYPGDTLSVNVSILEKRGLDRHRGRGDVDIRIEGVDGDGDAKIAWTALTMMASRDDGSDHTTELD